MALNAAYSLQFAGVPFCLDMAARIPASGSATAQESLIDHLNRIIPFRQLQDFHHAQEYPGRNQGSVARELEVKHEPCADDVKIGEWFYPNGATKFSVFRGLATSSQVKAMLLATASGDPAQFVMKALPDSPNLNFNGYELVSQMSMLPPRPLAEHGGQFDGLYLVTLVDERFYWQYQPVTIRPDGAQTWEELIFDLENALGVDLEHSAIEEVYGQPEGDSHLWSVYDNLALLLDAVGYNVGRTVVRNLDGTYNLYTPDESFEIVQSNRSGRVTRTAGGDLFTSGAGLRVGNLNPAKNVVAPASVVVTFPKYVIGDPIPHFYNPRGDNSRWFEDQFGDTYPVEVPIASGGIFASGLIGHGTLLLQDLPKAYYYLENDAVSGAPLNLSGLTALSMQLADDYYGNQVGSALDEVYPGTVDWGMEGFDDVIWTYSAVAGGAFTRVLRGEWTGFVRNFQHALELAPDAGFNASGIAGPSIPLTIENRASGDTFFGTNYLQFGSGLVATQTYETSGGVNGVLVNALEGAASQDRYVTVTSGDAFRGNLQRKLISLSGTVTFHVINAGGDEQYDLESQITSGTIVNFYSPFTWIFNFYQISGTSLLSPSTPKAAITAYSGTEIIGITSGMSGQLLVLWNVGTGAFDLSNENGGAPAGTQIKCPIAKDYTIYPRDGQIVQYDGSGWRFDSATIQGGPAPGAVSGLGTDKYALRSIKAGSGLAWLDDLTVDGGGIVMLASGAAVSSGSAFVPAFGVVELGSISHISLTLSGTGLEFTAPYDGAYHITADASLILVSRTLQATISIDLYNLTAASPVVPAQIQALQAQASGQPTLCIAPITTISSLSANDVVELRAVRDNSVASGEVSISSRITWFQLTSG